VRARGADRGRFGAGLALLFVFAVVFGQPFAASRMVMPVLGEANHGDSSLHLMPADMMQQDRDEPCKHRGGPHGPGCHIAVHCSTLSAWIATVEPVLLPASLGDAVYRDMIAVLPDPLGPAPATPPPRYLV
jgi:hypothetical protein